VTGEGKKKKPRLGRITRFDGKGKENKGQLKNALG